MVEVFDFTGKVVLTQLEGNSENTIPHTFRKLNVADLPAGIYILKICSGNQYSKSTFFKVD